MGNKSSKRIDISGLDMPEVLIAFYEHAGAAGLGLLEAAVRIAQGKDGLTIAEAKSIVQAGSDRCDMEKRLGLKRYTTCSIDYVKGRRLKLYFMNDATLDASVFEELSEKSAAEIVRELREARHEQRRAPAD